MSSLFIQIKVAARLSASIGSAQAAVARYWQVRPALEPHETMTIETVRGGNRYIVHKDAPRRANG
jgi:hypothetical protein